MPAGQPLLTQPRDTGEILDRAALVIRSCFPQMFRGVLVAYLPWSLLMSMPLVWGAVKLSAGLPLTRDELYWHVGSVAAYLLLDALLLRQFMRGWLFAIAGAELRGMTISSVEAAGHGMRRLPSACMATLLTSGLLGAIILLGAAAGSQEPAVVLTVMFSISALTLIGFPIVLLGYVAVALVQLERRGPFSAFARSFRLCGSSFGTTLVIAIVLLIVRFASGLIPALATNLWLQTALQSVMAACLVILDVAVESVLYFTLRCRREDYDLELLSREVELWDAEEVETLKPAYAGGALGAAFPRESPR